MATINERMFARRKQLKISQQDLAEQIESDQRQVSRYENGVNAPTADVLFRIAVALNTTTDYLLGLTDYPERDVRGRGDLTEDEKDIIEMLRSASPDLRAKAMQILKLTVSA